MSTFSLNKIRRGDYAKIARKTGYDASYVSRVLRGETASPNKTIMSAAKEMTRKRK